MEMTRRIITDYVVPPIPVPAFYTAYYDDLGADDSPYGFGLTEAEAIEDLKWQEDDE